MVGAPPCALAQSALLVRASMATTTATAPATRRNGGCRRCQLRLISAGSLTTKSLPLDARLAPAGTTPCQFERPTCWLGHSITDTTHVKKSPVSASKRNGGASGLQWRIGGRQARRHDRTGPRSPHTGA